LVDAAQSEASVLAALRAAGFSQLLSESTEQVCVSNWGGLETMSLAKARATLAPDDPRLDSYLKRMPLWFEARSGGTEYRAYYIKSATAFPSAPPPSSLSREIADALRPLGAKCILPQAELRSDNQDAWLPFFGFATLILVLCAIAGPLLGKESTPLLALREKRLGYQSLERIALRFALIAPCCILASGGLSSAALATLCGLALIEGADKLDLPLDELRRSGLKPAISSLLRQGLPSWPLPAVAILALVLAPAALLPVAAACLASILALMAFALASVSRNGRRPRFTPVPIAGSPHRAAKLSLADMMRTALACIVILAWVACRLLSPAAPDTGRGEGKSLLPSVALSYPAPAAGRGSVRPLPAEARSRAAQESGSVLPGLASYLEHRAIQESLPYLPAGSSRADPFSLLNLPKDSGQTLVIRFDEDWAKKAYADIPALSIENMLLSQGETTVGRVQSGASGGGRPLAPIECLLYIFLLVPPIGRLYVGVSSSRGAASGELRQEA
jgi:hypothetical protein